MQKTSSIVNSKVQVPQADQMAMPTWFILVALVISLVILKTFIYIKDGKRHGK